MAKEKDRASKRFFSDAKIFSELINLTLFNGKKIVNEKDLKERDPVKSKAFSKTKSLEVLVDNLFDVEIKEDNRNTYAIIGGDEKRRAGIVLAKSTPAKRKGIKTAETIYEAKRKCQNLKIFPPNYDFYKQKSHRVL